MSTRYESVQSSALYSNAFGVVVPVASVGAEVWPRKPGVFIRQAAPDTDTDIDIDTDTVAAKDASRAEHELAHGQFGLVPRWVKSVSDAKLRSTKLVNARSETVTTSNNFRDAWLHGQRCIVPMMAFTDDDWRSGKAVPTRIARVDGKPMGVAGLWESWTGSEGDVIISYTVLTVNANSHALMSRYQQPGNEKRMLAILNEGAYDAWLNARPESAREFMRAYPANWLTANPVQKGPRPELY